MANLTLLMLLLGYEEFDSALGGRMPYAGTHLSKTLGRPAYENEPLSSVHGGHTKSHQTEKHTNCPNPFANDPCPVFCPTARVMDPPASLLLGPTPQGVSWLIWINTKTAIEREASPRKRKKVPMYYYCPSGTASRPPGPITCAKGGEAHIGPRYKTDYPAFFRDQTPRLS